MNFKTIAFHHFGCKVNFAEASALSRKFQERGLEIRDFHDQADVYVISTCVVTAVAEKKCRAAIRQAHRLNPKAKIAVIGCFPELKPEELAAMDGVDLVLGHTGKFTLVEELEKLESKSGCESGGKDAALHEYHGGMSHPGMPGPGVFVPSFSLNDRTRSFLKIQDGCDYYCSYCTIPLARGHSRSDTIANAVKHAGEIVRSGIREIVLTGVNIGDFGRHTGESFLGLISSLNNVPGLERIRISSIEPDLLSDDIIRFVAGSVNLLPHFHIPLQSGCNRTLAAMKRKYTREHYASRVRLIRELMPYACIAADVIVGFPGETEEDFNETYEFLQGLEISYLHVFTYSERENTLAAKSPEHIPERIRKERSDRLHRLSDIKKTSFYLENAGREVNVLFESDNSGGFMHGFSENYIRVKTFFDPKLVNNIVTVKLELMDSDGVYVINDTGTH